MLSTGCSGSYPLHLILRSLTIYGMNTSMPSVSDIAVLLAALERYPIGSVILLVFALVIILGIWVYRQRPAPKLRPPRSHKTSNAERIGQ